MARCHYRLIAAALACLAGAGSASADYPERPIRLIVPFPAGGTVDLVARLTTASMTHDLKQPFGTDRPHVNMDGRNVRNDGDLVDLIPEWIEDAATQQQILVDDPRKL